MRTHTFVLDTDTTQIIKSIPKQKKSQFIREAIQLKMNENRASEPEVPRVKVKIEE